MRGSQTKWSTVKIYGPAALLYAIIAIGLLLPVFQQTAAAQQVRNDLDTALSSKVQSNTKELTGHPINLSINRLGIKLSIKRGEFNSADRTWTLDPTHLFVSTFNDPQPIISTDTQKQPLRAIFYGHNTDAVLLNTKNITEGDILQIDTVEGDSLLYYYVSDELISPTETSILRQPRQQMPTALVTCNGIWSTKRRVMYFAALDTPSPITINKDHHND
jgi:hypothetical protein